MSKKDTVLSTPSLNPRYVPKSLKHNAWRRDGGICSKCGSNRNLNYDHITPVALGGASQLANLRLLCFHCNQRASANLFGLREPLAKKASG